ncbi:uncharacterized protein [Euwallacea fornicatus]|uniref:uncharacterized protein isoform X1 n=1 Tax=Euwallacea fornicatus TaxID=995702 RepID=UPI00338EDEB0
MASILGIWVPHVIWESIFSYLTTTDLINFCKTSDEYDNFLRERNIVKSFDISCNYDFCDMNLYTYIKSNVAYEYIKSLNINKLHWVSLGDLRKLVKSLSNLEELYALNTALSMRARDIVLYGKLKSLAITIEGDHLLEPNTALYQNNLYLLRKLCLHVIRKHPKFSYGLSKLFTELFGLNVLWIYDSDSTDSLPISYDMIVEKLQSLNQLVIKSRVYIPLLDYRPFGLAKYFSSTRFKSIIMCYERIPKDKIVLLRDVSIFKPFESKLEQAWSSFRLSRCEMPFDPKVHREIYLTQQIKNVKFEELNFFHYRCFCTKEFIRASWDFLKSENSVGLKKLSIKSCILQREHFHKDRSLVHLPKKYPILDIIENCPRLNTLELMQCSRFDTEVEDDLICNVSIIDAYPFISNWRHLEKLTLEVPSHLQGDFLIDLTKYCTNLKLLRIISDHTNEYLNRNTYKALEYASNLQDFCFENLSANLPVLFDSLCKIRTQKLHRVFINCDYSHATSLNTLESFLVLNPQLILLFLSGKGLKRSYLNAALRLMHKYKKNCDYKTFFARQDARDFMRNFRVCEVDDELFNSDSVVSSVDFYSFR